MNLQVSVHIPEENSQLSCSEGGLNAADDDAADKLHQWVISLLENQLEEDR